MAAATAIVRLRCPPRVLLRRVLRLLAALLNLLSREPGGSGTPVRAGAGAGMWLWEEQGNLLGPFSFLLLLVLLVTRSPFNACLLTGSFYLLLRLFSFEPVPSCRALQVLKPQDRASVIAHRGGSHDAPENTLAAIRQVSPPLPRAPRPSWELGLLPVLPKVPQSSCGSPSFPVPPRRYSQSSHWSGGDRP